MAFLRYFKKGWECFEHLQTVQTLMVAVWPAGAAMLVGTLGYLQGQPYMWIIMAASLTFMGLIVGFVYANAWRDSKNPLNKLRYISTVINYDLIQLNHQQRRANAKKAQERQLEKTQIGVMLQNYAQFPISVILHSAKTEMEDEKPPRTDYPKEAALVFNMELTEIA